jgi:hypothetical protein
LTTGLKAIDRSTDLQDGQSYIVNYENRAIGNRRDLWLGIIVPTQLGPQKLVAKKRPRHAKPQEGEWDTPIKDRVHMFYLPGKNI